MSPPADKINGRREKPPQVSECSFASRSPCSHFALQPTPDDKAYDDYNSSSSVHYSAKVSNEQCTRKEHALISLSIRASVVVMQVFVIPTTIKVSSPRPFLGHHHPANPSSTFLLPFHTDENLCVRAE
jgi:hypothetical protein